MTFLSALLLGLLASGHCAAMCGGVQTVLQQPTVVRSAGGMARHLTVLNLGRITTYVIAGVAFSGFGSLLIGWVDMPTLAQLFRIAGGAVLVLIGIQLVSAQAKPFATLEWLGAGLWARINGRFNNRNHNRISRSYLNGMIWGLLPCGLVYGVLVTTVFVNTGYQGALVLLGFGLGTLPAMLLTGGPYQQFRLFVGHRGVRWAGAVVFVQGGLLMLLGPWLADANFLQNYPQLMSSMFCLS